MTHETMHRALTGFLLAVNAMSLAVLVIQIAALFGAFQ
jgi:hypothetical protein